MIRIIDKCTYRSGDTIKQLSNKALKALTAEIKKDFATKECPKGCAGCYIELTGDSVETLKGKVVGCPQMSFEVLSKKR